MAVTATATSVSKSRNSVNTGGTMRYARHLIVLFPTLLLSYCLPWPVLAQACSPLSAGNAEQCLRLNHIQVLGTHNSYKLAPTPALVERLDRGQAGWAEHLLYEHRPLTEQLETLGIRQFELDLFADPEGGLFSRPAGAILVEDRAFLDPPEMQEPGFKVLHVQDVDYRSHCLTLVNCLAEIRDWSMTNPLHLPIMVLLELKDSPRENQGELRYTQPVRISADDLEQLHREIRSVFDDGHLIRPGEVRGNAASLSDAVTGDGWPTLADSRGRVLFALDNTGRHRELYRQRYPEMADRLLFVSARPGAPDAGFIKMNDVLDEGDRIRDYVAAGYLVRTRSDIPLREGRSGDTTRRDRALASGAQFISTDFPFRSPFNPDYRVILPGASGPGRCNPVSAPAGCRNEWLTEQP